MTSAPVFTRRATLALLGGSAAALGLPLPAEAATRLGQTRLCRAAAATLRPDDMHRIAARVMTTAAAPDALEQIVRADYHAGRSVLVDRLVLSETEACIAALLARPPDSAPTRALLSLVQTP